MVIALPSFLMVSMSETEPSGRASFMVIGETGSLKVSVRAAGADATTAPSLGSEETSWAWASARLGRKSRAKSAQSVRNRAWAMSRKPLPNPPHKGEGE